MRIIAIDPGASGALAFSADGKVVVHKTKDSEPYDALQDAIGAAPNTESACGAVCYMERVQGFAGQKLPGSAMFNFGDGYGYWRGLLRAMGVRTILVTPQQWQKGLPGMDSLRGHTKKAQRKRALRDEAARRFPGVKVTLDNCDALLIMDFAIRNEK